MRLQSPLRSEWLQPHLNCKGTKIIRFAPLKTTSFVQWVSVRRLSSDRLSVFAPWQLRHFNGNRFSAVWILSKKARLKIFSKNLSVHPLKPTLFVQWVSVRRLSSNRPSVFVPWQLHHFNGNSFSATWMFSKTRIWYFFRKIACSSAQTDVVCPMGKCKAFEQWSPERLCTLTITSF